MYADEEYLSSCKELDTPNVDGWELFVDCNNVKIYRLYNETTGLYSYKLYGGLPNIQPSVCAKVYLDLEYRKQWDGYVRELREFTEDKRSTIYWVVKFPFPLSNRDYVYERGVKELDISNKHVWVVLARATSLASIPPVQGIVRVSEYNQSMAITDNGSGGTKAFMCYYDNPGGQIPKWLINWAAKTGVPKFLDDMDRACQGYEQYLAKKSDLKN